MWRTEVEILYVVGMVDQISQMILAVVIATTGRVFKPVAGGRKNVDSQYEKITEVTKTEGFYVGDQNIYCTPNRRGVAFGGRKTA
jgi:hypothetical protein